MGMYHLILIDSWFKLMNSFCFDGRNRLGIAWDFRNWVIYKGKKNLNQEKSLWRQRRNPRKVLSICKPHMSLWQSRHHVGLKGSSSSTSSWPYSKIWEQQWIVSVTQKCSELSSGQTVGRSGNPVTHAACKYKSLSFHIKQTMWSADSWISDIKGSEGIRLGDIQCHMCTLSLLLSAS